MKISRRAEALAILTENPEQRKYVSATPCAKCGGVEMRIEVAKGLLTGVKCWDCKNNRAREYGRKLLSTEEGRAKNRDATRKIYATPEGCAKIKAACHEYCRKIRATEEGRVKANAASLSYARNNPGKVNARSMKRRAAKLQRTPAWADLVAITDFYENCPAGYHVDHVIPLRGELVSGLHVLENLQYLPASENCGKCNKFDPWTFAA